MDLNNMLHVTVENKVKIAYQLSKDLIKAKEILIIVDNGCIVTHEGVLVDWFLKLLELLKDNESTLFALVTNSRIYRHTVNKKDFLYVVDVPELSISERQGLFKRFLEFNNIILTREDFKYFCNLFTGFPEQVLYTIDIIKSEGLQYAKDNTNLIVGFNTERVTRLVNKYESNEKAFDFLHLLSAVDFVSYEFLFQIVVEDDFYKDLLNEFFRLSMLESIGATKEYFRLNDTIKDYVQRQRLNLNPEYRSKIKEIAKHFIKNIKIEGRDFSEYMYMMKDALLTGKEIPEEFLIPSHFLKTMIDLYNNKRRFNDVIVLADRVLENSEFMDKNIEKEIRYWLCLSLARNRDPRFLNEIQTVTGPDHDFLMGFYYRLKGKYEAAIERLVKVISVRPKFFQAKRELVQVYLNMEDYEKAFQLARSNYEIDLTPILYTES